jgi:uncharacterized membrane protein
MDDEVKVVALVIIGLMGAISVYPILAENRVVEPFSELGVLGPNLKLGDYPKEVSVGEGFNLYLYVGNHEGRAQYYEVRIKLGDMSMNVSDTIPLEAPVLASYGFVLANEGNETLPVSLSVPRVGLNLRLVFELWRYSPEAGDFVYHQRWNQLWMNVTSPG